MQPAALAMYRICAIRFSDSQDPQWSYSTTRPVPRVDSKDSFMRLTETFSSVHLKGGQFMCTAMMP